MSVIHEELEKRPRLSLKDLQAEIVAFRDRAELDKTVKQSKSADSDSDSSREARERERDEGDAR